MPCSPWLHRAPRATFNGNQFVTGTLTQLQPFTGGRGIPTELLRFQREDAAKTEDFSVHIKLDPTDRLRFNFEVQHIKSDRTEDGFISAMQTYTDVFIDNQRQHAACSVPANRARAIRRPAISMIRHETFYWFLLDNQVKNEGELTSMRFDAEYDVSDEGFFKKARFRCALG